MIKKKPRPDCAERGLFVAAHPVAAGPYLDKLDPAGTAGRIFSICLPCVAVATLL